MGNSCKKGSRRISFPYSEKNKFEEQSEDMYCSSNSKEMGKWEDNYQIVRRDGATLQKVNGPSNFLFSRLFRKISNDKINNFEICNGGFIAEERQIVLKKNNSDIEEYVIIRKKYRKDSRDKMGHINDGRYNDGRYNDSSNNDGSYDLQSFLNQNKTFKERKKIEQSFFAALMDKTDHEKTDEKGRNNKEKKLKGRKTKSSKKRENNYRKKKEHKQKKKLLSESELSSSDTWCSSSSSHFQLNEKKMIFPDDRVSEQKNTWKENKEIGVNKINKVNEFDEFNEFNRFNECNGFNEFNGYNDSRKVFDTKNEHFTDSLYPARFPITYKDLSKENSLSTAKTFVESTHEGKRNNTSFGKQYKKEKGNKKEQRKKCLENEKMTYESIENGYTKKKNNHNYHKSFDNEDDDYDHNYELNSHHTDSDNQDFKKNGPQFI